MDEDSNSLLSYEGDVIREEVVYSASCEKKQQNSYEPILPPCRICGAKATGYHFGAITCEACKVSSSCLLIIK